MVSQSQLKQKAELAQKKIIETVTDLLAEGREWKDDPIDPFKKGLTGKEKKEKYQKELKDSLYDDSEIKAVKEGFNLLKNNLNLVANEKLCLEELNNAGKNFEKYFIEMMDNLEKNKETELPEKDLDLATLPSLAEQLGISFEVISSFYEIGLKIYELGRYEDAIRIFTFLSMLAANQFEIWIARGMSHTLTNGIKDGKKDWAKAVMCFTISGFLRPSDPSSYIYNAECYLMTGDLDNYKKQLELAEYLCQINPDAVFMEKLNQLKAVAA